MNSIVLIDHSTDEFTEISSVDLDLSIIHSIGIKTDKCPYFGFRFKSSSSEIRIDKIVWYIKKDKEDLEEKVDNSLQNYVKIWMLGINELMKLKFRIKEINHRKIKKRRKNRKLYVSLFLLV